MFNPFNYLVSLFFLILVLDESCATLSCPSFEYSNSSNQCVAICGPKEFSNTTSNTCERSYPCSATFIQQSSLSQNRQVQAIVEGTDSLIYAVYDVFINTIDQSTGAFVRRFSFDTGVLFLNTVNSRIFLINTNTNTVIEWVTQTASVYPLATIAKGSVKTSSDILLLADNSTLVSVSVDETAKAVYFNQIQKYSQLSDGEIVRTNLGVVQPFSMMTLSSDQQLIMKSQMTFIQSGNSFKIIEVNQVSTLPSPGLSIAYYQINCLESGDTLNIIILNSLGSLKYIATFKNTPAIFLITKELTCISKSTPTPPTGLVITDNRKNNNRVLVVSGSSYISIYTLNYDKTNDSTNLILLLSIPQTTTLISTSSIMISNSLRIYALTQISSQYSVISYEISLESASISQTDTISVWIESPSRLIIIQQTKIFVIGQDIQIINSVTKSVSSVIRNFKNKVVWNEGSVSRIIYAEISHFLVSCSADGKIVVWKAIEPLAPTFYYSIKRSGESCLEAYLFQNEFVIAKYTSGALSFRLRNRFESMYYPANPNNFFQIAVSKDYMYVFANQTILFLSSPSVFFQLDFSIASLSRVFVSSENHILAVDAANFLSLFQLTNSLPATLPMTPIITYQLPSVITCIQLFNLNAGGYQLAFVDGSNQTIWILNTFLNLIITYQITIGTVYGNIFRFEEYFFFFLVALNNPQLANKFSPFGLDIIAGLGHIIGGNLVLSEVAQVKKRKNYYGEEFLTVIGMMPLSYTSATVEGWLNEATRTDDTVPFGSFMFSPGQYAVTTLSDSTNTYIFMGALSGYTFSAITKKEAIQLVQKKTISLDYQFSQLLHEFLLGRYCIVSVVKIICYCMHTDNVLNTIIFTEPVNQILLSGSAKILIATSASKLAVQNFSTGEMVSIDATKCGFTQINGFYFDEAQGDLYIYGNGLVKTKTDLAVVQLLTNNISQLQTGNMTTCLFLDGVCVCKVDQLKMAFFDRTNNFELIIILTLQNALSGFQIAADTLYSRIYVYVTLIEIYTYQGIYFKSITSMASQLIQFSFYDSQIVAMTYASASIFLRSTLVLMSSFNSAGGGFLGGIYLRDYKQIAYFSDEVRNGQVLFFNLDSLTAGGSTTSTYTPNGIGRAVKAIYDPQSLMLNFIDIFGNTQNIVLSNQRTIDNCVRIEEIKEKLTDKPIDYFIDFKTNTVYIINSERLWRFNYNILLRPFSRLINRPYNNFVVLQNSIGSISDKLLVVDSKNTIFLYSESQITFSSQFSSEIMDFRLITQNQKKVFLVVLNESFLVYIGDEIQQITEQNSTYQLPNTRLLRFLMLKSGKVIFITSEHLIVDYDFANNQMVWSKQLAVTCDVTATLITGEETTSSWNIYFGTDCGSIISYDLLQTTMLVYEAVSSYAITIIRFLGKNLIAVVDNTGGVFTLDQSTMSLSTDQSFSSAVTWLRNQQYPTPSITSELNGQTSQVILPVTVIEVDLTRDRLFVNLKGEKKIGVFQVLTMAFLQYLSFPDEDWKNIIWNEKYLLIYCSSQVNLYNINDLSFVDYIRRYHRKDRLTDIRISQNRLILVFTTRIEGIIITSQPKAILIHSVTLTDPKLILISISDDGVLRYIGVSAAGIFERKLSLDFYEQQASSASFHTCSYSLTYSDQASTQNSFDSVLDSTLSMNYLFSVLLHNQIKTLAFLNSPTSKIILRPADVLQNTLNIRSTSFQQLPFNVFMDGFDLVFLTQGSPITMNSVTTQAIFQNLSIKHQVISYGTSLLFDSPTLVIFQSIMLDSVRFQSNSRILNESIKQIQISDRPLKDIQHPNNTMNTSHPQSHRQLLSLSTSFSSAFLKFTNSQTVILSQFTISNCTFEANTLLASFSQFTLVRIEKLTIINSRFDNLINLFQGSQVTISDLTVLNCTQYSIFNSNVFSFSITGVSSIQMSSITAKNNTDLQLIMTTRKYSLAGSIIYLTGDTLNIGQHSEIENNTFVTLNISSISLPFFSLESSEITINNLFWINNQGNILLSNANNVNLSNSLFQSNFGAQGGGIYANIITGTFSILNTKFLDNQVSSSGGALYLYEIFALEIDSLSTISGNQAAMGGGIRIITLQQNYYQGYQIFCSFKNNKAEIFGDNIGTYPTHMEIYTQKKDLNAQGENDQFTLSYSGEIISSDSKSNNQLSSKGKLQIENIQSGGITLIRVKLFDQDKRVFSIDSQKYQLLGYSPLTMSELNQYFIEAVVDYTSLNNDILELKGEALLSVKQYDDQYSAFCFTQLILSSKPFQTVQSLKLKITQNIIHTSTLVPTYLQFRSCLKGETEIIQTSTASSSIISCQKCSAGTYSLSLLQSCQQCPSSASSCEGSAIVLKKGYWRQNTTTDEILECEYSQQDVCQESNPDSKKGCMKGYIGPLCAKCDVTGVNWDGVRYSYSLSPYECGVCTSIGYQLSFSFFAGITILLYLFFSIFFFMDRYLYNSKCCYLRLLTILPFSTSCILDESSFFVKSLLNYLQMAAVLFSFQLSFFPSVIVFLPQLSGQPVSKVVVSLTCMASVQSIQEIGEERIRSIMQSLLPFAAFITLLITLAILHKFKIWQVGSYHKYMMMNVVFLFFQSDSLSFFTKAFSCKNIGSHSYRTINLELDCNDSSYSKFAMWFILPNLLFWTLTPGFILYSLIKHKKTQHLSYCTMKYKFGYYYLEFKEKYYYWEFIRIYFKMTVVILITLLQTLGFTLYMITIILIFIYIMIVMHIQPFQSRLLYRLEILSYLILVPSIFFGQLYILYPHQLLNIPIVMSHYGYLTYMAFIILKFKLFSRQQKSSRFLRCLLKFILPSKFYQRIPFPKEKSLKPLFYWKIIYRNIRFLRHQKVQEQYESLNLQARMNLLARNMQYLKNEQFNADCFYFFIDSKTSTIKQFIKHTDSIDVSACSKNLQNIKDEINEHPSPSKDHHLVLSGSCTSSEQMISYVKKINSVIIESQSPYRRITKTVSNFSPPPSTFREAKKRNSIQYGSSNPLSQELMVMSTSSLRSSEFQSFMEKRVSQQVPEFGNLNVFSPRLFNISPQHSPLAENSPLSQADPLLQLDNLSLKDN